ncbi:MAG: YfbM family protein [Planctomycetes bacterium]|nr:YfbM family protein [Planctomycetota bacterium]
MPTVGYFLALTRDEARRLFGLREDEDRWSLVRELRSDEVVKREGRVLECGAAWEALHRALGDGTTDVEGGDYPRNHCVLGGRVLNENEPRGCIVLKRPDMTEHVAESLAAVSEEEWDQSVSEKLTNRRDNGSPPEHDVAALWRLLQETRDFYHRAAQQNCAVVFVAENEANA